VKSFEYARPESLDELLTLMRVHGPGARLLAGGTDLLVRIRKGIAPPAVVIDLKRVAELRDDITTVDAGIRIGARAVMTDVIAHPSVRQHFPALVEAAMVVGSVQIRNRATLAGNLCNASPAADTAPALLAYAARVNLVSAAGTRDMLLDEFFAGPGCTALTPGELVESIDVPVSAERTGGAFERLTRRHGVDLAIVNLCCVVHASGDARFAFGAVGPRPLLVTSRQDAPIEDALTGASPISDLRASDEYRAAMLRVLARRALKTAVGRMRAPGWSEARGPRAGT
jgi:CO/xanthine dehydrogenase FAD-binding subunit